MISSFEAAGNHVNRCTRGVDEDYDTNKTDRTEVLVSRRDWTYCDIDWGKKEYMWHLGEKEQEYFGTNCILRAG